MNTKRLPFILTICLLLSIGFISCEKENKEDITPPVETVQEAGIYILNRGNWKDNNASISYYNLNTEELTANIYEVINKSELGGSAEQMIIYGSKIYVTVTRSNRIAILDLSCKLITTISPTYQDKSPMEPRCMTANNGKIYISYYAGHSVAMLDTTDLKIKKEVAVGRYPEQVAVGNDKLYVANSGGMDYPNYGKTISVVNLSTFKVEKEIEVIINPKAILTDKEGDIFVISLGNYEDIDETLQRIDSKTGVVTTISKASKMTLVGNTLYTVYAPYGNPNIEYKKYDTQTEKYIDENFIKDGTKINNLSSLSVDPKTGEIYIGTYDYQSTSSMYRFTPEGTLIGKPIETGGLDTQGVCFYNTK